MGDLVRMCFSGKYTRDEVMKMLNGNGGLMAYLGTTDCREVEKNALIDAKARLCLDAMIYQVCKQVGAMATVLRGEVDQILITGGIAYSAAIVQKIADSVDFIAPVTVYPGENEMDSLAWGSLAGLKGEEQIKEI